jgi:hypothetical protein
MRCFFGFQLQTQLDRPGKIALRVVELHQTL